VRFRKRIKALLDGGKLKVAPSFADDPQPPVAVPVAEDPDEAKRKVEAAKTLAALQAAPLPVAPAAAPSGPSPADVARRAVAGLVRGERRKRARRAVASARAALARSKRELKRHVLEDDLEARSAELVAAFPSADFQGADARDAVAGFEEELKLRFEEAQQLRQSLAAALAHDSNAADILKERAWGAESDDDDSDDDSDDAAAFLKTSTFADDVEAIERDAAELRDAVRARGAKRVDAIRAREHTDELRSQQSSWAEFEEAALSVLWP